MLETIVARANALGYRTSVQTGSFLLAYPGEEPRIFYYLEDAEAFLDRRHLSCVERTEKHIARDAEQAGRITRDRERALEEFEYYWSEKQFLFGHVLTPERAQAIFVAGYMEGMHQFLALRLKAVREESGKLARVLALPPGYTIDSARGDGWVYPQYYGQDIARTSENVYRFRTADGARQFVQKAGQKLTSLLGAPPQLLAQKG